MLVAVRVCVLMLHSEGSPAMLVLGLVHRHHSQVGLLFTSLSFGRSYMVPSDTMETSPETVGGIQVSSGLGM